MPSKHSAEKAHRQGERRYERNRSLRSALRTFVKHARASIGGATEDAANAVALAAKRLDAAASKGVIPRNQASRRKSRLMRQLALALRPAAEPEAPPRPARARAPRKAAAAGATPRTATRSSASGAGTSTRRAAAEKEPPAPRRSRSTTKKD